MRSGVVFLLTVFLASSGALPIHLSSSWLDRITGLIKDGDLLQKLLKDLQSPLVQNLIKIIETKGVEGLEDLIKQMGLVHSTLPEIAMGPAELIQHWGYPVERHDVTTEDGYILSVYRIPHGRNETGNPNKRKPVIFMQHGLEGCCTNWLTNLPHESAAYIFADAGFDVWMGNFRGTTYSNTHTTLSNKDHAYWQFTWDEMAQYDLPSMLYHTLNVTGAPTLYYVGHSMGTMTAFAKFAEDQTLAKRIKQFYALGPVHTLKHVKGVLRVVAPFTKVLQNFFAAIGYDDFLPSNKLTEFVASYVCGNPKYVPICMDVLYSIAGPSTNQMNQTRMPVYVAHSPAGTSVNNIAHFGQMVMSGKFEKFDWGSPEDNMNHYGQVSPPEYDITTLRVPVGLYWGEEDWLADPEDVEALTPLIRNLVANVYLTDFNHLDFIWGLRAAPEVYQPILYAIMDDWEYSS